MRTPALVTLLALPALAQDDYYQRQLENRQYEQQLDTRRYETQQFQAAQYEQQRVRLQQERQQQQDDDARYDAQQRQLSDARRYAVGAPAPRLAQAAAPQKTKLNCPRLDLGPAVLEEQAASTGYSTGGSPLVSATFKVASGGMVFVSTRVKEGVPQTALGPRGTHVQFWRNEQPFAAFWASRVAVRRADAVHARGRYTVSFTDLVLMDADTSGNVRRQPQSCFTVPSLDVDVAWDKEEAQVDEPTEREDCTPLSLSGSRTAGEPQLIGYFSPATARQPWIMTNESFPAGESRGSLTFVATLENGALPQEIEVPRVLLSVHLPDGRGGVRSFIAVQGDMHYRKARIAREAGEVEIRASEVVFREGSRKGLVEGGVCLRANEVPVSIRWGVGDEAR